MREQNRVFGDLLVWFFYSCGPIKKKAFLQWMLEIGRNDVVKKIYTASIRMKLYTANAHMEMKREMQREQYMKDKYGSMSKEDFLKSYDWGVYITYYANDYVRNTMKKHLDYEIQRAYDTSKSAVQLFIDERVQPTIVTKRFRETMSEIGKSFASVDSTNSLFRDKSYFLPDTDPYGYGFDEENFEHQTANLQKFVANTPHDIRFGSSVSNLLGLDKESLHRGGSLYPGDEDYDLNQDAHEYLDITDGQGFLANEFDELEENTMVLKRDATYRKFVADSPAGHFHKTFDQILLRMSRNTVAKKGGRVESYNCIMLVGTQGFCGIGFGQAPSPTTAEEKAKLNALKNLTSLKVDPKGVVSKRLDGRFRKSNVIITPNREPGVRGHPVLSTIARYLGLHYITIKTFGSRNLLSVIPAFYNCLEKLTTVEDHSMLIGQMPVHMRDHTSDFREQCRNRHTFGFQWNK